MYAVILAGGGGTRLWPLSRSSRPKPFLPLLGAETLLQRTARRLPPLIEPRDVYVVTDARYVALTREQLPEVPAENVLGEPAGRNTAPAVALAAIAIDRPTDDVMVVLPADHRVRDEAAFRDALSVAGDAAAGGLLVILGIAPTGPETGYGYIVAARETTPGVAAGTLRAEAVERFVEKPDRERALALLESGRASWNAGIFVWRRDELLAQLERHAPAILQPLRDAKDVDDGLVDVYPRLPAASVDHALMEPASLEGAVRVVPADVGWSDIGSWSALLDVLRQGEGADGVVTSGHAEDLDSRDVMVHSAGGRLVVTIGLRGTIVVDTPDVVLVCDRERSQDVKRIVDRLTRAEQREYL